MTLSKHIVAFFMSFVMCVSLFYYEMLPAVGSSAAIGYTNKGEEVPPNMTTLAEIESERTASSKTFINSDGTNTCVVYTHDVHYIGADGKYYEIDNSIKVTQRKGFLYSNSANAWKVFFAQDKLEITYEDYFAVLSLPKANSVSLASDYEDDTDYSLSLKDNDNAVVYSYDGFCIVYSVSADTLKEDIVIYSADALQDYSFNLELGPGLSLSDKNGLELVDSKGNVVFKFLDLYMYDSIGKWSNSVDLEYTPTETGSVLTLKADKSFFTDDTVYPVIIDPSISKVGSADAIDTYVDEQYPSAYYCYSQTLGTGGYTGYNRKRSFIKYVLPTNINASQITRATLSMRYSSGDTPTIKAYRITTNWSQNNVSWNAQPSFTTTGASETFQFVGNGWYAADVTSLVYAFMTGTYSNYGFALKNPSESSTSSETYFYSSDALTSSAPVLKINYVNTLGTRGYESVNSTNINCMGYAMDVGFKIQEPQLGFTFSDIVGMTTDELLSFFAQKSESWMSSYLLDWNWEAIDDYDSYIFPDSPGWYRICLRVGIDDTNNNGVLDYSEHWDFHWWYQTNIEYGIWAQKPGGFPSEKVQNSNGLDPATLDWPIYNYYYNSDCIYYQLKNIR